MSSRDDRTTTPAGRQLLVLADRDAAEEVAEALAERWPALGPFELVRDALAGEDDAEDAQWLVVLEEPAEGWDPATVAAVDALAGEHEGWREDG
ncbi:hypothetical protein E6W39_28460 [Kitasatospora acidiphila]|uniref:Uncharacterized protein n=1 Tax=Kitasatospora acidiphila TaxID=2567942 RepID=A0A540W939_9ACTN|nr:hypothetical protein [Kitasatospora acidiphila]TQF05447.1 hypothetical protein E6W39_28460 [Kitasatospora acidiphila]